MFGIYVCFFCLVGSQGFLVPDGLNTVSSPAGDVVGFIDTVEMHSKQKIFRKFLGIPYAEPPTGDRRFAKPVPKARFPTPFDATREGPACYQLDIIIPLAPGLNFTEDCLTLNIYAPVTADDNQHPVMIFIHGGGLIVGMANDYDGQYLSAFNDVIVVTINYRLAVFGMLSTGDSAAPGNFALWDQHLAIKWVHDNIQAFGGDSSRVTVFGNSAGAFSVVYQTLYPGNRGLFQRAIAESGSITNHWAFRRTSKAQRLTRHFSKYIGCEQQSSQELVKCLRSKTATEIHDTMNDPVTMLSNWPPVKDDEFILDEPNNLLSGQGHSKEALEMFHSIDLMIGVTSKEGLLNIPYWTGLLNMKEFHAIPRHAFEDVLIPNYLNLDDQRDVPDVVKQVVIFEYTDWTDPNNDNKRTNNMVDLDSDANFFVPAVLTANAHATNPNTTTSTYVYKFSTRPLKHFNDVPDFLDGPGVANHEDELQFVFGAGMGHGDPQLQHINTTRKAKLDIVQRAVMTTWTNFAKTGDPNKPDDISVYTNTAWPEYGTAENFLEITTDMTSQSVKQRLAPKAFQFWHHLVPEMLKSCFAYLPKLWPRQ